MADKKFNEYTVTYTVRFRTVVKVEEEYDLHHSVSNIDIPENEESKYVANSFEILKIQDSKGNILLDEPDGI